MLSSIAFLSLLYIFGYSQSPNLCQWSNRVLAKDSHPGVVMAVIKETFWGGWIDESRFSRYPGQMTVCNFKSESFFCESAERTDGLHYAMLNLNNIANVDYINIMSFENLRYYPTTIHRVTQLKELDKTAQFLVYPDTKLDICPNATSVKLQWTVKSSEFDARGFTCYDQGILRCQGINVDQPIKAGICNMAVKGNMLIHETTVNTTGSERLSFYTCSFNMAMQRSMTYIVDWIDANKLIKISSPQPTTFTTTTTAFANPLLINVTKVPSTTSSSTLGKPYKILTAVEVCMLIVLAKLM